MLILNVVQAANRNRNKVASNETETVAKAGIMTEDATNKIKEEDEPNKVPISQETINTLLICKTQVNQYLCHLTNFPLFTGIMIVAVVGIVVGLICRKDIGGIKTKCCRTSKPEPKDQVHPTEEIPLNKLA